MHPLCSGCPPERRGWDWGSWFVGMLHERPRARVIQSVYDESMSMGVAGSSTSTKREPGPSAATFGVRGSCHGLILLSILMASPKSGAQTSHVFPVQPCVPWLARRLELWIAPSRKTPRFFHSWTQARRVPLGFFGYRTQYSLV